MKQIVREKEGKLRKYMTDSGKRKERKMLGIDLTLDSSFRRDSMV